MSFQGVQSIAYGLSAPTVNVFGAPIIATRNPTTLDRAALGTMWINRPAGTYFFLTDVENNVSTWVPGSVTPSGGGDYVLIETQTAADVTELDFTTGITTDYNSYVIVGNSLINTNVGGFTNILAQISIDGGATYITTGYAGSSETNGMFLGDFASPTSFTSTTTSLYNLTSGTDYCMSFSDNMFYDPNDGSCFPSEASSAYRTAATIVNAIRIVSDDSTAFSGTISLYGLTK